MEPAQRRAMLSQARRAWALPSTDEIDAQQRVANPLALMPAPFETTTELIQHPDGSWSEVPLKPLRLAIGPTGFVDLDERDAAIARQQAIEESDRSQRGSRGDDAGTDVAERVEHEQALRQRFERELPDHLKETAA
jgi:hypothetical protein